MAEVEEEEEEEPYCIESHDVKSLLLAEGRDFLIHNNGDQVNVSNLEGKVIAIYFSGLWCNACRRFDRKLIKAYKELSSKYNDFEIVFVSADDNEDSYWRYFSKMPWLAIPFSDFKTRDHLINLYFDAGRFPQLVILDRSGNILCSDGVEIISNYGSQCYPFTGEKINKVRDDYRRAQSLQSMLGSPNRNFLLTSDGNKVPISSLIGKTIFLYFCSDWFQWSKDCLSKLIQVYHEIKAKDSDFEIVFSWFGPYESSNSFNDLVAKMPWLALPFGDKRNASLRQKFNVYLTPFLLPIDPRGYIITMQAWKYILTYGADAYPFTGKRVKELEAQIEDMAKGWRKKMKNSLHREHELELTLRRRYTCGKCGEEGKWWSFYCNACHFEVHPGCAMEEDKKMKGCG